MKKSALITGISGQDGAYLARLLLEKNYEVTGIVRGEKSSLVGLEHLKIKDRVKIIQKNLLNYHEVEKLIQQLEPDEIYHLAAQSSVGDSFKCPVPTIEFNTFSTLNLLESIRLLGNKKKIKFYQASSSEMFGKVDKLPVTEKTAIHPLSPYAVSKASAHWTTINYRESYGLFACSGILFNHESYLRKGNFFLKKVLREAIAISKGEQDEMRVGNIEVRRDFGYGPKYVEAMWLMLQQEKAEDFLICSGASISLKEIIHWVFERLDISMDKCVVDPTFYRPTDIDDMYGDNSKARKILGWDYNMNFFEALELLLQEELLR